MPITSEILKKYKKNINVFVETGSFHGDGIFSALTAGFDRIYSIEFYQNRFEFCKKRFESNNKVILVQGDSSKKLEEILEQISESILFWLDAHYDAIGIETDIPTPLANTFPLLEELEQIKRHSIKTHTILIDDRRIMKGNNVCWKNIKEETVCDELRKINSKYIIDKIDSSHFKKDIIVAEV